MAVDIEKIQQNKNYKKIKHINFSNFFLSFADDDINNDAHQQMG